MPATIRHSTRASPVMLVGTANAIVASPPRLVRKPWAPAYRTWFSITSWIALSTFPFCSRSCLSAAREAGGSGPMLWMARCSASRTNAAVSPGASSDSRAGCRVVPLVADWDMPRSYGRSPSAARGRAPTGHYRGPRAGRTVSDHLGVSCAVPLPPRGRPGRDRRRPRAGHGAGGVPPRAVSDAGRGAAGADGVVQPRTARRAAAGPAQGLAVPGQVGPAVRGARRHRLRRGDRRVRRPRAPLGVDRRPDPDGVPPPPRARVGALGRDVARRAPGRRALRAGAGRAVRGG